MGGAWGVATTYPEQGELQCLDKHEWELELGYGLLDLKGMVVGHLGHVFPRGVWVLCVQVS